MLLLGWILFWALLGAGEGAEEPPAAEAVLRNIAGNVTLILFQIHAHYRNVTISFEQEVSPSNSGTGVDGGLVSLLRPEQTVCTWYLRAVGANQVLSTAVSLPYTERDPIPGGCNLEFDLEMDPNLYLDYNLAETRIMFAPANLGYARGAPTPCGDSGTSLDSRWRLLMMSHHIFARKPFMMTLTSQDKTELYFSSLPGQGVIYNVIGEILEHFSCIRACSYLRLQPLCFDPIPGGCNLEFDLEMDPNLGAHPPSCDSGTSLDSRWRLSYDVYQYFLPENDLSEATFVSHMRRMTEVPSIWAHGSKMMTLTSQDKTELFRPLPGQGVIYNVIVRDPKWNTSAAYVPVHTYACSLSALPLLVLLRQLASSELSS
ncbi:hypothetical protein E2320_005804 [Naja naja]|nr:hypothetical protein E2320_005804 [Naja naja]